MIIESDLRERRQPGLIEVDSAAAAPARRVIRLIGGFLE